MQFHHRARAYMAVLPSMQPHNPVYILIDNTHTKGSMLLALTVYEPNYTLGQKELPPKEKGQ